MPLRLFSLFLFFLSSQLLAAELKPFSATYSASFNGIGVTAERRLSGGNSSWRLDFSADSLFANIEEYSRFGSEQGHLVPQHYEYHKTGLGRDRHTVLNFEPGRVVNVSNAKRTLENAPKGVLDKISYQLQLALDVAAGKKTLEYLVADGRKIRDYKFAVAGKETLQTPLGSIETIKVQRLRDGDSERETVIWFAPQWNYALVKLMQQEEDGKTYQISLTKLSIDEKSIKASQ
ncbi:DUF3108 domain-containing protein [Microbulbifer taiwanensis]|uniref:DUF3108 domain-containing protein n=1 Tax=Microbulbifer taiwanensis TaxID=986746 RepID=A0ABW1YQQ2_9GAMM|nr:DUF3108 domain-containing protein [Microbulbifer taiwanensis]